MVPLHAAPVVPLTPYQREWVEDASRYKLSVKARRTGFTFGATLEVTLDAAENSGAKWLIISRTQDAAREAMEEVKHHLEVFQLVAEGSIEISEEPTDLFFRDMRINRFRIELPNGSIIQALTAHPDAARGFGGHVLLDEHGFHEDSKALWRGVYAATLRGHKIRVISTPNYQQGNYYELARKAKAVDGPPPARRQGIWSVHWTDIHTAIPQLAEVGVPINLDELRELAGDPESFAQEFECRFLSSSEMWLTPEMIAFARSALATKEWDAERPVEGALYGGMDIGRRKDRTVIWVDDVIGTKERTAIARGVIELQNTPFREQLEIASAIVSHPQMRRFAVDETGMGMMLAEELERHHGRYKVERVTFNLQTKEEMAVLARQRFEQRLDKIPEDAPEIERALAAIKRVPTSGGRLRFDAERSEAGHADHAWAKFLADYAADQPSSVGVPEYFGSGVMRPSAMAGGY